jgi:hypothetical protein
MTLDWEQSVGGKGPVSHEQATCKISNSKTEGLSCKPVIQCGNMCIEFEQPVLPEIMLENPHGGIIRNMMHPIRTALKYAGIHIWTILGILPILICGSTSNADKVITKNGQTLEGLIKTENRYYIHMDVQGTITRMPIGRIRKVIHNSPEENVRSLLDRGLEAISRDDIDAARTLVEQARSIKPGNMTLLENLNLLDQEITDLEQRGGSAEQRRLRADALLSKANTAYDRIRTEAGNELLIQALRTDPEYEEAHKKINHLLSSSARPDHLLAAEYFASVLWSNEGENMRPDSPVIPLLPATYTELAERFDKTNNLVAANRYAELIRVISDAYANNPTWIEYADINQEKELINEPVNELLSRLVKNNLEREQYDFAYQKLQSWADPTDSAERAELFARALIGAGEFTDALRLLGEAIDDFPDSAIIIKKRRDALLLLRDGDKARQGSRIPEAVGLYDQVYALREILLPEMETAVGQRLAEVQAPILNLSGPSDPRWVKANVAAMIARFSPDPQERQRAAKVFSESVPSTTWNLDLEWQINRNRVNMPEDISSRAETKLSRPLHVRFDDRSPFLISMLINMHTTDEEAELFNQFLLTPEETDLGEGVKITSFNFNINAAHPALGTMMDTPWETTAIPPNLLQSIIDRGGAFPEGQEPSITIAGTENILQYVDDFLSSYLIRDVTLLVTHLSSDLISELLKRGANN